MLAVRRFRTFQQSKHIELHNVESELFWSKLSKEIPKYNPFTDLIDDSHYALIKSSRAPGDPCIQSKSLRSSFSGTEKEEVRYGQEGRGERVQRPALS